MQPSMTDKALARTGRWDPERGVYILANRTGLFGGREIHEGEEFPWGQLGAQPPVEDPFAGAEIRREMEFKYLPYAVRGGETDTGPSGAALIVALALAAFSGAAVAWGLALLLGAH
jgi:hypothetical protein